MSDFKMEKITPSKAKKLMEANTKNFRKLDMNWVMKLAADMLAGEWENNGETIKIHRDGFILDGQHRLLAIIESGVSVWLPIVRNLDCEGKYIDRGQRRTINQWAAHMGYKNASSVAATTRTIVAYKKGRWGKIGLSLSDVPDSEIHAFMEKYEPQIQLSVKAALRCSRLVPTSILGAVLFVGCGGTDPSEYEIVDWFLKSLKGGGNLSDEDAVLHLRNRLAAQTPGKAMTSPMKRWLTTLAWNKTATGEACTMRQFRYRLTGPTKERPPAEIEVLEDCEDFFENHKD